MLVTVESAPPVRLFTNAAISVSTFVGGPLAAGYLLSRNFEALGQVANARRVLRGGIAVTAGLFLVIVLLPEHVAASIPKSLVPALYSAIASGIVFGSQQEAIDAHLKAGGRRGSGWTVAGISVLSLALTLAYVGMLSLLVAFVQPPFEGEAVAIGKTGNTVYVEGEATAADARLLGELLTEAGYFADDFEGAAQLRKDEAGFEIVLMLDKVYWDDPDIVETNDEVLRVFEASVGAPAQITVQSYSLTAMEERVYRRPNDPTPREDGAAADGPARDG